MIMKAHGTITISAPVDIPDQIAANPELLHVFQRSFSTSVDQAEVALECLERGWFYGSAHGEAFAEGRRARFRILGSALAKPEPLPLAAPSLPEVIS